MKKFFKKILNDMLLVSCMPEICWHLLVRQQMRDEDLSSYFNWIIGVVSDDE